MPDPVPVTDGGEVDSGEAVDTRFVADANDAGRRPDAVAFDAGRDVPDVLAQPDTVAAPDTVEAPDATPEAAVDAGFPEDVPIALPDAPTVDLPVDLGVDVPVADVPLVVDVPPVVDAPDVPPAVDVPPPVDVPAAMDVPPMVDVPPAVDVPAPPVDVGFPINWHTTSDVQNTPWRSGAPSDSHASYCGAGQVLTGISSWHLTYVSGLAPWCSPLNANGTLGSGARGGQQGGSWGSMDDDRCPAGQVVVRFTIHSGSVIDNLQVTCAPLATWLSSRTFGAVLSARGGGGGSSTNVDDCPAGYVGAGFDAHSDTYDFGIERVFQLRMHCVGVTDH